MHSSFFKTATHSDHRRVFKGCFPSPVQCRRCKKLVHPSNLALHSSSRCVIRFEEGKEKLASLEKSLGDGESSSEYTSIPSSCDNDLLADMISSLFEKNDLNHQHLLRNSISLERIEKSLNRMEKNGNSIKDFGANLMYLNDRVNEMESLLKRHIEKMEKETKWKKKIAITLEGLVEKLEHSTKGLASSKDVTATLLDSTKKEIDAEVRGMRSHTNVKSASISEAAKEIGNDIELTKGAVKKNREDLDALKKLVGAISSSLNANEATGESEVDDKVARRLKGLLNDMEKMVKDFDSSLRMRATPLIEVTDDNLNSGFLNIKNCLTVPLETISMKMAETQHQLSTLHKHIEDTKSFMKDLRESGYFELSTNVSDLNKQSAQILEMVSGIGSFLWEVEYKLSEGSAIYTPDSRPIYSHEMSENESFEGENTRQHKLPNAGDDEEHEGLSNNGFTVSEANVPMQEANNGSRSLRKDEAIFPSNSKKSDASSEMNDVIHVANSERSNGESRRQETFECPLKSEQDALEAQVLPKERCDDEFREQEVLLRKYASGAAPLCISCTGSSNSQVGEKKLSQGEIVQTLDFNNGEGDKMFFTSDACAKNQENLSFVTKAEGASPGGSPSNPTQDSAHNGDAVHIDDGLNRGNRKVRTATRRIRKPENLALTKQ